MLLLATPAAACAVVASCNPLFGIVSRTAGSTWCQQDAQVAVDTQGGSYCADFDRGDAAGATPGELAASVHATVEVADDVASSPPNSLKVVSSAVPADAGVLAGYLIPFGQGVRPGVQLPRFMCQVDVYGEDLSAAAAAGVSVGVIGVGGQAVNCSQPAPILAVVGFRPGGLSLSLERFSGPTVPAEVLGAPVSGNLPVGIPAPGWTTLKLMVTPAVVGVGRFDGGSGVGEDDAGNVAGCTAGRKSDYIVIVELAGLPVATVRVPDLGFALPMVAYGSFIQGPAEALPVHVDNIRCASMPSGS